MFDPTLSFPGCLESIGERLSREEFLFDSNAPYVLAMKDMRAFEDAGGDYDYLNPEFCKVYNAFCGAYNQTGIPRLLVPLQMQGFPIDIAAAYLGEEVTAYFVPSIMEPLGNAIDHGSDFGRKGPVKLGVEKGSKGLVAIIEDPGNGCDFAEKVGKQYPLHRGNGLKYLRDLGGIGANSERFERGFRVILHYPRGG